MLDNYLFVFLYGEVQ